VNGCHQILVNRVPACSRPRIGLALLP